MHFARATLAEQGRAIMAGLADPVDLTESYLDAIRRHPHAFRIYARVTETRARCEAIAAHDRAKAGLRRHLLDGVALSWKDNIDSAGVATEAGSHLLEGRVPEADAPVLSCATAQGAICLGKTHMTELAFSGLGVNPATASPPNALNADLVAGGSSSGAAVSVALGLAAGAVGTDTGGSIRVPAAWNGLVGFKPTQGTVEMGGVVPLCRQFDVAGPIVRSVEDAALVLSLLTGTPAPDLREPRSGLRLLVLDGIPFEDAQDEPVAAFEQALERLGARIDRAAPACVPRAMELSPKLFAPEAYGLWRAQIEAAPELMHPPILARFRSGRDVSAPDYIAAWEVLARARREWAAEVAGYDAVILPTVPILPPGAEAMADEAAFTRANLLCLRNTRIANLLGLPAVTLPIPGAPGCGIMAMGRAREDRALMVVAAAMERALAA